MVNRELLAKKLAELAKRIARIREWCPKAAEDLANDPKSADLVCFNLMLAVQSCADIASHVIADESWPSAATIGDAFDRLFEKAVIDGETARALRNAVGLRNLVAHAYEGMDLTKVHFAATAGLGDLESFARQIASWAIAPAGPSPTKPA